MLYTLSLMHVGVYTLGLHSCGSSTCTCMCLRKLWCQAVFFYTFFYITQITDLLFFNSFFFINEVGLKSSRCVNPEIQEELSLDYGAECDPNRLGQARFRYFRPHLAKSLCDVFMIIGLKYGGCLLYTSPSPRDLSTSRMPSSA